MMILCFSGTGNSRYIAHLLADALRDEVTEIGACLRTGVSPHLRSDTPWVLVCPTYAWRVPRVVESFLRGAKLEGSRELYFVLTCGSETGNARKPAAKLASACRLTFMGLMTVPMPENYIALFTVPKPEIAAEMLREAEPMAAKAAVCIRERTPFPAEPPQPLGGFLTGIVNPCFYLFTIRDKPFRVTDACVGCGKCERVCPMGNIAMESGHPLWQHRCTHCMACISACPKSAIQYGKRTEKKRRWLLGNAEEYEPNTKE